MQIYRKFTDFTFKLIYVVKHKKKIIINDTTKKKLHYICTAKNKSIF